MLIDADEDIAATLAAEDAAIAAEAAQLRALDEGRAPVDGGTVTAEPGTPLADLIGWMSDGRATEAQVHGA